MTNFEKFLRETTKADVAEALSGCFEGKCDECPALDLCNQMGDQEEVGCTDVMLLWLDQEAEQEHEAAAEAYLKAESIYINGEPCLHVQTYPSRPEGGGGGFVYPMGTGDCRK